MSDVVFIMLVGDIRFKKTVLDILEVEIFIFCTWYYFEKRRLGGYQCNLPE